MVGVTVLGSTGTIGVNTLDVLARHPDRFQVFALAANRDHARLQFTRQHSLDIGAAGADGQEASSPLKETVAKPVCAVKSHRVIGEELLALAVVQLHTLSAASDEFWIGQG